MVLLLPPVPTPLTLMRSLLGLIGLTAALLLRRKNRNKKARPCYLPPPRVSSLALQPNQAPVTHDKPSGSPLSQFSTWCFLSLITGQKKKKTLETSRAGENM